MAGNHTDPPWRTISPRHPDNEAACKEAIAAPSGAHERSVGVSAQHSPKGTSVGFPSSSKLRHLSTFLCPLARRALPRFFATMDTPTPARSRSTTPSAGRSPFFTSTSLVHPFRLQPPAAPRSRGISGGGPDRADAIWASPFTRGLAGAAGRIEFACATDWMSTLGCSPPPLTRTQLPSVSGFQTNPGKGFPLLARCARRRTSAAIYRRFPLFSFSLLPAGEKERNRKRR